MALVKLSLVSAAFVAAACTLPARASETTVQTPLFSVTVPAGWGYESGFDSRIVAAGDNGTSSLVIEYCRYGSDDPDVRNCHHGGGERLAPLIARNYPEARGAIQRKYLPEGIREDFSTVQGIDAPGCSSLHQLRSADAVVTVTSTSSGDCREAELLAEQVAASVRLQQ